VAPTKHQVVLAVQPLDAHVFRGEEDLGVSPVVVEVTGDEKVSVVVRRRGYKDQTITLDASEPKRSVKLALDHSAGSGRPAAQAAPAAPPKPVKKKPSLGGGEIVNPWE
jgi:hypothetical protein